MYEPPPNFPPPSEEHPLRGRVLDALMDEGFRPDIDDDGDVAFKVQGQQLFVRCMEGDFTIMRVFGQWQVGDDIPQDELAQLRACNDLTLRLNVVKAGLANGPCDGVRILGTGEVTKKLKVTAHHFSKSAKEKLEAKGGTCEIPAGPKPPVRSKAEAR